MKRERSAFAQKTAFKAYGVHVPATARFHPGCQIYFILAGDLQEPFLRAHDCPGWNAWGFVRTYLARIDLQSDLFEPRAGPEKI